MEAYCFSLGEDYILTNKMNQPRYDGASTVLNEKVLWITGGKSKLTAGTSLSNCVILILFDVFNSRRYSSIYRNCPFRSTNFNTRSRSPYAFWKTLYDQNK